MCIFNRFDIVDSLPMYENCPQLITLPSDFLATFLTPLEASADTVSPILDYYVDGVLGNDDYSGNLTHPKRTLNFLLDKDTMPFDPNNQVMIHLFPGIHRLSSSGQILASNITIRPYYAAFQAMKKKFSTSNSFLPELALSPVETLEKATIGLDMFAYSLPTVSMLSLSLLASLTLEDVIIQPWNLTSVYNICCFVTSWESTLVLRRVDVRYFHFTCSVSVIEYPSFIQAFQSSVVHLETIQVYNNFVSYMDDGGPDAYPVMFFYSGVSKANLTLHNSTFENNRINGTNLVGGIFYQHGTTHIENTRFSFNDAMGGGSVLGGVFHFFRESSVTLQNCLFDHNTALTSYGSSTLAGVGGAIFIQPGANVNVISTTFAHNYASSGAAIGMSTLPNSVITPSVIQFTVNIEDCIFESNFADGLGIAIYADALGGLICNMRNNIFKRNYPIEAASEDIDAVISIRSAYSVNAMNTLVTNQDTPTNGHFQARILISLTAYVEFTSLRYEYMYVARYPGSLFWAQDCTNINLSNFTFHRVTETVSDLIMVESSTSLILLDAEHDPSAMESSVATVTDVDTSGIVPISLFLYIRTTAKAIVQNVTFTGYQTSEEQGMLYSHTVGRLTLNNIHVTSGTGQFIIYETYVVTIINSTFKCLRNHVSILDISRATTANLVNVQFSHFLAPALRAIDVAHLSVDNSSWTDGDVASFDGGGIYLSGVSTASITNSKFNNIEAANGGAIFSWTGISLTNCSFIGNSGSGSGGAIFIAHGFSTIDGSDFISNSAPTGGAIFVTNPESFNIRNSYFDRNQATAGSGGAIQIHTIIPEGTVTIISDVVFLQNQAIGSGGAISIDMSSRIHIMGSMFLYNAAGNGEFVNQTFDSNIPLSHAEPLSGFGGAIFARGYVFIYDTAFTNNIANSGGAIYIDFDTGRTAIINIIQSEFASNYAFHSGGTITFQSTNMQGPLYDILDDVWIANSNFRGSGSGFAGGTIAAIGHSFNTTCGANSFEDSGSTFGGVFYFDLIPQPTLIKGHKIITAHSSAGGIAYYTSFLGAHPSYANSTCSEWNSCKDVSASAWGPNLATGNGSFQFTDVGLNPHSNSMESLSSPSSDITETLPFPILGYDSSCPQIKFPLNSNFTNSFLSTYANHPLLNHQYQLSSHSLIRSTEPPRTVTVNKTVYCVGTLQVHSGVQSLLLLRPLDQFGQIKKDESVWPINIAITPSVPLKLQKMTGFVTMNDYIILDTTFRYIDPPHHIDDEYFLNLTITFEGISDRDPNAWAKDVEIVARFEISKCPVGYGFLPYTTLCQPCPYNTFNLNGDGNCVSCTEDPNLACWGDTVIATSKDFWVYSRISENIATSYQCIIGYCNGDSKHQPCAPGRTGILCGICEAGLTESLLSSCGHCESPNYGLIVFGFFTLWLVALGMHMMVAVSSGKATILFFFIQTALIISSDVPLPWTNPESTSPYFICLFPMDPLQRRVFFMTIPLVLALQIAFTFVIQRIWTVFLSRRVVPILYTIFKCCKKKDEKSSRTEYDESKRPLISGFDSDSKDDLSEVYDDTMSEAPSLSHGSSSSLFLTPDSSNEFVALDSGTNVNSIVNINLKGDDIRVDDGGSVSDNSHSGEGHADEEYDEEEIGYEMGDEDEEEDQEADTYDENGDDENGDDETQAEEERDEDLEDWTMVNSPTSTIPLSTQQALVHNHQKMVKISSFDPSSLPSVTKLLIDTDTDLQTLNKWRVETKFFHRYRLLRTILSLLIFTYSSASQLAFALIDCIQLTKGGPMVLIPYPAHFCDSKEYKRWLYSLILLVPILVAILAFVFIKLVVSKYYHTLSQMDVRFGILYEMYKPNYFLWKVYELIRRTTIIAIYVFLNSHPIMRGLVLCSFCFIFLVAQALTWPYRRRLENTLETLSTAVLAIISIASIWRNSDSSRVPNGIIWISIFVTTAVIIVAFAVSIIKKHHKRVRKLISTVKSLIKRVSS